MLLPLVCGIGILSVRCASDPVADEINPSTRLPEYAVQQAEYPLYIRFDSEYEQMIDLVIELEDGNNIDLYTGPLFCDPDYLEGTIWMYPTLYPRNNPTVYLPLGDHILWFSSFDYPQISQPFPFTLTEKGGEFSLYHGTWGGGGSPSFSYSFTRLP